LGVTLEGLVVKEQSGFYWVETEDGTIYIARLRGRLKEDAQVSDLAAIGDRVAITPIEAQDGIEANHAIIEQVHERHSTLSRAVRTTGKRGSGQAEREHVLIANPDQALFVFAAAQPTPNWQMLDRLLVTAESARIDDIVIIFNKADLGTDDVSSYLAPYQDMGYDILMTSVRSEIGLEELRTRLQGKISVLTGPSGVGKTSLLNAIQPNLGRAVKSVSDYSQEGMHTTRDSALIKLDIGGYLADTPGIRMMTVWNVEPDELDAYFRDIAGYSARCRFRDCMHTIEPGCAILKAVEQGQISPRRYEHFIQLREELRDTYIVY
jgi:ribosome biogenesis GTPase